MLFSSGKEREARESAVLKIRQNVMESNRPYLFVKIYRFCLTKKLSKLFPSKSCKSKPDRKVYTMLILESPYSVLMKFISFRLIFCTFSGFREIISCVS